MPLRHTFNKEYYNKIFEIINLSKKDDDEVLFKKFYNTTLRIYQKLN